MLLMNLLLELVEVGIDLPELIRLKLSCEIVNYFIFTIVGIDLPELIRLKLKLIYLSFMIFTLSGLICLN